MDPASLSTKSAEYRARLGRINHKFIEKIRPRTFDQIVGNAPIVNFFRNMAETRDFRNVMLYGRPGIGKTSLCLVFARAVFQSAELYDYNVRMIAASNNYTVADIRSMVYEFSQRAIAPPYKKIVILDEADSITSQSSEIVCSAMSTFSETTMYIIVTNNLGKIDEHIKSQCEVLHFDTAPEAELEKYVTGILEEEFGETLHGDLIKLIGLLCANYKDIRRVLNYVISVIMLNISADDAAQLYNLLIDKAAIYARATELARQKNILEVQKYLANELSSEDKLGQFIEFMIDKFVFAPNLAPDRRDALVANLAMANHVKGNNNIYPAIAILTIMLAAT